MPIDSRRYPKDWTNLALTVKEAAGWRCKCCNRMTASLALRLLDEISDSLPVHTDPFYPRTIYRIRQEKPFFS